MIINKKRLSLFFLVFLSIFFISCTFDSDPKYRVRVVKGKNTDMNNLFFLTYLENIYGCDLDTMELKLKLKTTHFNSCPVVYKNKMFIGDMGYLNGWGGYIYVLDDSYSIEERIEALPNLYNFTFYENYLIAQSMCYYSGGGGVTVLDGNSLEVVKNYTEFPGLPDNNTFNCGYDGKIYITSDPHGENQNFISVFDKNGFKKLETTDIFQQDTMTDERTNLIVYENQLWINYMQSLIVKAYNLDDRSLIKSIDLKSYLDLGSDDYRCLRAFALDDKYYIMISNYDNSSESSKMLCFDTNTMELIKIYELPVNCDCIYNGVKLFENQPDYIYFFYEPKMTAYKYSLKTGSVAASTEIEY